MEVKNVLSRPFPCSRFISRTVRLVGVSNLWNQRIIGIRVRQHRADREQD